MPLIGALLAIFKVWMLVDCFQRCGAGCSNYWYIIVLMPFGDFIYFFTVKIHDPEFSTLKTALFTRPTSLKELRYRAKHSSSAHNKLLLAQALHDRQHYSDALQLFKEVHDADIQDKEALYGLAVCKMRLKDFASAMKEFEMLVAKDPGYRDYQASLNLASCCWDAGEKDKAVETLRRIVRSSHRTQHVVELAKCLVYLQRKDEAKQLLHDALEDFTHAPRFVKRSNRGPLREVNNLLKSL